MEIETYKIEEVKGEAGEMVADSLAIDLVKELGLTGQQKLVKEDTATRMCFRRMTKTELSVYNILFPEQTKIELFETEIIPVRVLELAKEARDSGQFVMLQVWHARTKKEDPLLVGLVGKLEPQTWNKDYINITATYLIARWGEALQPFKDLCEAAKKVWINQQKSYLRRQIVELEHKLKFIEDEAMEQFSTV